MKTLRAFWLLTLLVASCGVAAATQAGNAMPNIQQAEEDLAFTLVAPVIENDGNF